MPQVEIPAELYHEVEAVANGSSAEEFVRAALCEKLRRDRRMKKLRELTGEIRKGMQERGTTEEEILADFEAQREVCVE